VKSRVRLPGDIIFRSRLHHISLRSHDLVMPKLPACGCEWWWRLVPPSTGGDWWATCHNESCARYSRLKCIIRVSPLLPLPFTCWEGVLCGQQLRNLCLETELGKRKKESGVSVAFSVPLGKGDRVRTVYRNIWNEVKLAQLIRTKDC